MSSEDLVLVYDKECPACDNYCRMVKIRQSVGELKIVNAREDSSIMREISARGMDIDQGMVLKIGSNLYYGADAIHALALISTPTGMFNRINYWLFSSSTVSRIAYPVLRGCRNLLLKLLGKTRINNLDIPGNNRF